MIFILTYMRYYMLHVLYTPILNIVNSYDNQNDTIWKNINYLKYFYHLFPIHVVKFYSLFYRYVNPKIEELKTEIYSFSAERNITAIIESLTLLKLELDYQPYDYETITGTLERITLGSQTVVGKIIKIHNYDLQDLRERLEDLMFVAKNTAWTYITKIISIIWDQKFRMLELKEKIYDLTVKAEKGEVGRLTKIADHIARFKTKHQHEIDYLETVYIGDIGQIHRIAELRPWPYERIEIENVSSILKQIPAELVKYTTVIIDIYNKLDDYKSENISHGKKIEGHDSLTKLFQNISSKNENYQVMLKKAYRTLEDLEKFGKLVRKNKRFFKKEFRNDVNEMTNITHKELNQLYLDIKNEEPNVDKIKKYLDDNNLVLDYLKTIHDLESNLGESKIDNVKNHIGSLILRMKEILSEIERGQKDMDDKWNEMIWGKQQANNSSGKGPERESSEDSIPNEANLKVGHSIIKEKINEFKLSIESHLGVLEVMETVKAGLDVSKGRPGYSLCIGDTINRMAKWIDKMIKEYRRIHEIVGILDISTYSLKQLRNLKQSILWYREMIKVIRDHIESINLICRHISETIEEIQLHLSILLETSEDIAIELSKIAALHSTVLLPFIMYPMIGEGLIVIHNQIFSSVSYPLLSLLVKIGITIQYLSVIKTKLEQMNCSGFIKCIGDGVNKIDCNVTEVESSIESIIVCLLKCSNNSITNNTIESTRRLLNSGAQVYNNELAKALKDV